jgi:lipopolysaccharide transport system permease protein
LNDAAPVQHSEQPPHAHRPAPERARPTRSAGRPRSAERFWQLLQVLAWKSITLRYKQAYLGVAWVALKPIVLVLVFMAVRALVGIDHGDLPYPLLTYCALLPWVFFQEAATDGTGSVIGHASLVRKIYLPREVFPLAAALSKGLEACIGLVILLAMMVWYGFGLHLTALWAPVVLIFALLAALSLSFAGSALNVLYRDIGQLLPLLFSLAMYASPIIYPLSLVRRKLLDEQIAGPWSEALFFAYTLNPMAGVIDSFQRVMLQGLAPDWSVAVPGAAVVVVLLPLSYLYFKRAETRFADVI